MRLKRFGPESGGYDLQQSGIHQQSYDDNFADAVPRTVRLPGLSGGFDQYGSGLAPLEIGKVSLDLVIIAATRSAMDAKRRDLRALAFNGVQTLVREVDFSANDQWCYARINSIQMPQSEERHSDLWQRVRIDWQVADPGWRYTIASPDEISASGVLTTDTLSYAGTQPTHPMITITPPAGESCQNPKVRRYVDGTLVDEVAYAGTVAAEEELVINCETLGVTLDGANAYDDFTNTRAGWFTLLAGDNDIRVTFANAGDQATVSFQYDERYI